MLVLTDWSNWQGVPDAHAIAAQHPEWAGGFIKMGEGTYSQSNPDADAQIAQMRSVGKPWGAYQFMHPGLLGTADADTILARTAGYNPPLGIALDLEVSDGMDGYTICNRLIADLEKVRSRYPFRTFLYSAKWFMDPNVLGAQRSILANLAGLWVAGYTPQLPALPAPWTQAIMWQFTDNWAGMNMDASVFLGTPAQWGFLESGGHVPVDPALHAKTLATQIIVHAKPDGIFGPDTHNRVFWLANMRDPAHRSNPKAVKLAQLVAGVPQTGHFDKLTHDAVGHSIMALQKAWGVSPVDGTWSTRTAYAEAVLDPMV